MLSHFFDSCTDTISSTVPSSSAMKNRRRTSVLSALLLAMQVLLCNSISGVTAALRIHNNRADGGSLTVEKPFGCCNYCTSESCPTVCEPCKSVAVENGKQVALEAFIGPYPLESLFVEVEGGDIYSVGDEEVLRRLTATAVLQVGPSVGCEEGWPSISGRIFDDVDSGAFEVCLQFSENRRSPCILYA